MLSPDTHPLWIKGRLLACVATKNIYADTYLLLELCLWREKLAICLQIVSRIGPLMY